MTFCTCGAIKVDGKCERCMERGQPTRRMMESPQEGVSSTATDDNH